MRIARIFLVLSLSAPFVGAEDPQPNEIADDALATLKQPGTI